MVHIVEKDICSHDIFSFIVSHISRSWQQFQQGNLETLLPSCHLLSHSLGQYPQLMTVGEGEHTDRMVNRELHLIAQLSPHYCGLVSPSLTIIIIFHPLINKTLRKDHTGVAYNEENIETRPYSSSVVTVFASQQECDQFAFCLD